MATIDELSVAISAAVEESGFRKAAAALGGIEAAAVAAGQNSSAAITQFTDSVDKASQRITDSAGRVRDGFGKFVTSAQLAAEAAARTGGAAASAGNGFASFNSKLLAGYAQYDKVFEPLEKGVGRLGASLKDAGQSLSTYVTLPLAGLATAAVVAYGKLEALGKGLNAISTQDVAARGEVGVAAIGQAANETAARLKLLQEIAKAPGIGFEQAVQGDIRLRAVGVSAEQSAKVLREFANAIALTGGGAAQLDSVTVQLGQLAAKGKVLAQDLRPIIEAAPSVGQALKKLFGTVDSEEISKQLTAAGQSATDFIDRLTEELSKAPRVAGGLSNQLENLGQTTSQSLAKIGEAISKAIDLPGILDSIGNGISNLADGFANLSPGTQKFIVGLAATAAAAGPVLIVFGGLLAVVPQAVAGFGLVSTAVKALGSNLATFFTSPVGIAIGAAAALTAGIYYLATSSERALDSYKEQSAATKELTASVTPLLDRYDQLKAKTSLNTAEQAELGEVMQKLAAIVPEATAKLDENGKVAEISAGKVRALVKLQQELVQAKAVKALPGAEADLAKEEKFNQTLQRRLELYNQTGQFQKNIGFGLTRNFTPDPDALNNFREYLAQSNLDLAKQRQLVDELRGSASALAGTVSKELVPALTDADIALKLFGSGNTIGLLADLEAQLKAVQDTRDGLTTVALIADNNAVTASLEKQIKALKTLGDAERAAAENFRQIRLQSDALGDSFNYQEAKLAANEAAIKSLLAAGYSPFDAKIKELAKDADALRAILAGIADGKLAPRLDFKAPKLDGFAKQLLPSDFKEQLQQATQGISAGITDAIALPVLPDYEGYFTGAAQAIGAGADRARLGFDNFSQAQADFNANTERLIDSFPAEAFEAIGQSIGDAIASGGSVIEALGKGVLKSAADFLSQYGRLILLKGAADVSFGNVGQGLLELAAGAALVAGAGVVGGLAKGGGGSAAAGSGSYPKAGSAASSSGGGQTLKVVAEFRLRGTDLVAVGRLGGYRDLRTS